MGERLPDYDHGTWAHLIKKNKHKFDLDTTPVNYLVTIPRKRYNVTESTFRLTDEWNAMDLKEMAKTLQFTSLEEREDHFLQKLRKSSIYLKEGISYLQHGCKIIAQIRSIPAFHIAGLSGDLSMDDLQTGIQWVASKYTSGPQHTLTTTT